MRLATAYADIKTCHKVKMKNKRNLGLLNTYQIDQYFEFIISLVREENFFSGFSL